MRFEFGNLDVQLKLFPNPSKFRNLKPNPPQTHLIKFKTLTIRVELGRKALKIKPIAISKWD
jgi:hypothetical protein